MTEDNKQIERLVDKMMKHDSLQKPSSDFTANIMAQVEALGTSKSIAYKPLISKPVWILIGLGVLAIVGFAMTGTTTTENTWMPEWNLDSLYNNGLSNTLSKLKFSSITMYGVVFFALMLGVQISLLKKQHDKKWDF